MAATARKFELEPQMHERTVLEEKVDHIQEDVTGLKADVRRLDSKIDAVGASLVEHRLETEKSFAKLRDEMRESIATLRTEVKDSVATLRTEVRDSVAALRTEMKDSVATLRTEMKDSDSALWKEVHALRNDLTAAIGALRVEMKDSLEKLRSSHAAQIAWMVSTVIAATGVAFTVAKFYAKA